VKRKGTYGACIKKSPFRIKRVSVDRPQSVTVQLLMNCIYVYFTQLWRSKAVSEDP